MASAISSITAAAASVKASAASSVEASASSSVEATSASSVEASAATTTVVGCGLDHGHLDLNPASIEVLPVKPGDGALGCSWVIIGDGGFTLLFSGGVVAVDPDLQFSCPLVGLDDADGAEEVGDVVVAQIFGQPRDINLIVGLNSFA